MPKIGTTIQPKNEGGKKLSAFLAVYFNLLTASTVIIILAVGYMLILAPKYRQIDAKVKLANERLEKEYIKLSGYLKKLQAINNDYQNINQESIKKIKGFLPPKPEPEKLIEMMEFVAKNNGIILSSLDVDSGQDRPDEKTGIVAAPQDNPGLPPGVGVTKISMNMTGVSYAVMKNLIVVLEKSLRLMDVVDLKFSPGDESLILSINTYYSK